MIGISHWGLFPAWDSLALAPLQYAYDHGFVTLWERNQFDD